MNRRPRRGLPAALTGLLLLAGCALIATDAIQILAGGHPLLSYPGFAAALHRQHWNSVAPAIAAGGLALLGVLLLLAALLPGRLVVLALSAPANDDGVSTAGLSRRGFRNMLRATAASVDGVTSVSLSFRRTVIAASVHSAGPADGLADAVRAALERRLDQIAPARRPALRVRASTRSSS